MPPEKKKKDHVYTLRLPEELYDKVVVEAYAQHRPVSSMMRKIFEDYFDSKNSKEAANV